MGRLVNVVLPSGRVVAVDEQIAKTSRLSTDTGAQEAAGFASESNAEQSSGAVEGLKAAGEGALDAATFGVYGAARGALDPEGARDSRIRAQERPGARMAGELAAVVATAPLGAGAGAAGMARAGNLAVGGGMAGRAVEGAVLGFGSYVSSTNVTGDPLTIEAAIASATIGGVLEVGMGVAADKLEGMVWGNKLRDAKTAIIAEDAKIASKAEGMFKDSPPSWNEFAELHAAKRTSTNTYNKVVAKEAAEYAEHLTPKGLNDTIRGFDQARTQVIAEVNADPIVRKAVAAHDEATKTFTAASRDYEKVVANDEVFTGRLNQLQDTLSTKRGEFSPRGAPEDIHNVKRVGVRGSMDNGKFIKAKKDAAYNTGTPKQVISEKLDADLKGYNERLSAIYKRKGGGWRVDGGKWVADPSVKADLAGALNDAAKLRADMAQHFAGKKLARFPTKPIEPVTPSIIGEGRTGELVKTSREITSGVEAARNLMREGKYEEASLALADLRSRVGATSKELALPNIPMKPRDPLPPVAGDLPKSLEDFTWKHDPQVEELAAQLDPTSYEALQRVMKDLDVKITGQPAEDLRSLHKTLREYRGKVESTKAAKAAEAAKGSGKSTIQNLIERSARMSGGRAFDVGGKLGGITRTFGSEATSKTLKMVEGAALGYSMTGGDSKGAAVGAALMSGRLSIRDRLRGIITKYGVPTAGLLRKVSSPLAYLSQSFPDKQTDKTKDHGQLAINRIHEIQAAAMAAPDTAFLALQGMLDQPDDIAWKMHQHVVGTLNYLVSTLPKDPGTDTKMFGSNWKPAYHETVALAHRLEAINDPLGAITRAIAGNSHPAATEALWAVYPSIMNELAQEISVAAPRLKNLTYEQASAYSNLFRTPLTGLQQPVVVSAIQGNYMGAQSQSAPPPAGPGGGAPKKAVGRPPAVQNSVAGTNVNALTGQR